MSNNITNKTKYINKEILEKFTCELPSIEYTVPSEYVKSSWFLYQKIKINVQRKSNTVDSDVFRIIIFNVLIHENILPFHVDSKVAFVSDVKFDIVLYTIKNELICISLNPFLKKQIELYDLETMLLKHFYKKSISYLLTLDEHNMKAEITDDYKKKCVWLNDIIDATSINFDTLIEEFKKFHFSVSPTINIIESNHIKQ